VTPKRLGAAVVGVVVAVGLVLVLPQLLEPEEADEETIALARAAYHFVELDPEGRYIRSGGRRFFGLL
jgi:hypothetical protein